MYPKYTPLKFFSEPSSHFFPKVGTYFDKFFLSLKLLRNTSQLFKKFKMFLNLKKLLLGNFPQNISTFFIIRKTFSDVFQRFSNAGSHLGF